MKIFPDSSFFKEKRAPEFPPLARIRTMNYESGDTRANNFNQPPLIVIPPLGLVVKHGADVTIVEAQTQMVVREKLQDRVPVPEIFGWTEDSGQSFIYRSLVEGETLLERWGGMGEDERQAVCAELRHMANAWKAAKALGQDMSRVYIGEGASWDLLTYHPDLVGPFHGMDAVREFQAGCGIDINGEAAIAFTHADRVHTVPPSIVLSPGPRPKVAAVIDWGRAKPSGIRILGILQGKAGEGEPEGL